MGAAVEVEVALSLRVARFLCGSVVCWYLAALALVVTLLREAGQSWASDSQLLGLMSKSLRASLRQSLKHFFCPPTEHFSPPTKCPVQ